VGDAEVTQDLLDGGRVEDHGEDPPASSAGALHYLGEEDLVRSMRDDPDTEVREIAAWALGQIVR
jgi:hypothetical protein